MRSPLTRPEAALAGLAGLVLVTGSAAALALGGDDEDPAAAAPPSRSAGPAPTASAAASPRASPSATASLPQGSPSPAAVPASAGPEPSAAPEQRPPEQVAVAFFDAAVQGRDADALAVAEAQALSDLREYEAWESHRLDSCAPEQGEVVCVFEAEATFLRLALVPDAATGWRVRSVS